MQRRSVLEAGAAAAALALPGRALAASARAEGTRVFEVTTAVDLAAANDDAQLWLPVFATARPGQKRIALSWQSDAAVRLDREPRFGAEVLHARWESEQAPRRLTLVQRVAVWNRSSANRSPALTPAQRRLWLATEADPSDQRLLRETAAGIVGGASPPPAKLRALYDWVVANTWRDAAVAGCGPGDAPRMLRTGAMGGKCADINSLIVCLARAAGMPAREVYGIRVANSARFPSLGRAGDITGAQHCRAEVWLDGHGWFAVDPADVRKAVLEEKLAVDSPKIAALAEDLFGGAEGNWAGYNTAPTITLPGAPQAPRFRFLMYPTAMTAGEVVDPLDAARFAFRITARQLA